MARQPISRRVAFVYLVVSLAIAAFAGQAYVWSLFMDVPLDTENVTGIVDEVRYSHGRYNNISGIHFQIDTDPRGFVYASFFPSFEQVTECLVAGARVSVTTSNGGTDVWSLRCMGERERYVTGTELLESRRANGRAGAWVAIGFLVASGCWVWLIVTGRAA
jgi:hypothetical protein